MLNLESSMLDKFSSNTRAYPLEKIENLLGSQSANLSIRYCCLAITVVSLE